MQLSRGSLFLIVLLLRFILDDILNFSKDANLLWSNSIITKNTKSETLPANVKQWKPKYVFILDIVRISHFTKKQIGSKKKSYLHYFIDARLVEEPLYLFPCLNNFKRTLRGSPPSTFTRHANA